MAIAPIHGMLRHSAIKHVIIGISSGLAGGYTFWYGWHIPQGARCLLHQLTALRTGRTLEERDRRRLTLYSYDLVPPTPLFALDDRRRFSLDDMLVRTVVRRRDEWYLEQERRKQAGEA